MRKSIRNGLPALTLFAAFALSGCSGNDRDCLADHVTRAGGVTLTGTIQSVNSPNFVVNGTLLSGCAATNFQVDTNASTIYVHSDQTAASFSNLAVGGHVVVDGTGVVPTEILATKVTLSP